MDKKTFKSNSDLKCELCGSTKDLEVHHIIPKGLGGKDESDNYMILCHKCHLENFHGCNICNHASHSELTKKGIENLKKSDEPYYLWIKVQDIYEYILEYLEENNCCPNILDVIEDICRDKQIRCLKDSDHRGYRNLKLNI